MNPKLLKNLTQAWISAGAEKRDALEKDWPELVEAVDMVVLASQIGPLELPEIDVEARLKDLFTKVGARRVPKNNEPRCKATYNPGVWPYAERCILIESHALPNDHIDKNGREWKVKEPCDGCRTIERMRAKVTGGDETAAYEFQRAARHHRRECPNR